MEADDLPSTATLVRMLSEMKGLAYQQISEVLTEHDNLTLRSGGTHQSLATTMDYSKCSLKGVHIHWG